MNKKDIILPPEVINDYKRSLVTDYIDLCQKHIPSILSKILEGYLIRLGELQSEIESSDLKEKEALAGSIGTEAFLYSTLSGSSYYEILRVVGFDLVQTIPNLINSSSRQRDFSAWIQRELQIFFAKKLGVYREAFQQAKKAKRIGVKQAEMREKPMIDGFPPPTQSADTQDHTSATVSYILNLAQLIEKGSAHSAGIPLDKAGLLILKKKILGSGIDIEKEILRIESHRLREIVRRMISFAIDE